MPRTFWCTWLPNVATIWSHLPWELALLQRQTKVFLSQNFVLLRLQVLCVGGNLDNRKSFNVPIKSQSYLYLYTQRTFSLKWLIFLIKTQTYSNNVKVVSERATSTLKYCILFLNHVKWPNTPSWIQMEGF